MLDLVELADIRNSNSGFPSERLYLHCYRLGVGCICCDVVNTNIIAITGNP